MSLVSEWAVGGMAAATAAAALLACVWRSGAFSALRVEEATFGPYALLYLRAKGPVWSTAPRALHELEHMVVDDARMEHEADKALMDTIGLYYDDPSVMPANQCRCLVGYCVNTHGRTDIPGQVSDLRKLSVVKSGELRAEQLPGSRCLAVQLPFWGRLSVVVAVLRAYPLLLKEAEARLGADAAARLRAQGVLEVYRPRERRMWVALPLATRDVLLAAEAAEEQLAS
mmetsp:Transcript_43329/g.129940  ORF Transcript_43329/g.129940 Transcript_43329/m.129940 type:complete len:228 (-) Transcript_43329:36-719(-)